MAMGKASSARLRVSAKRAGRGEPGWRPGSPRPDGGGGKGQTAGADDHKEVLMEYNGDGPAEIGRAHV